MALNRGFLRVVTTNGICYGGKFYISQELFKHFGEIGLFVPEERVFYPSSDESCPVAVEIA